MRLDDTRLTLLDRQRVERRNKGVARAENNLYPTLQHTNPTSRIGRITKNATTHNMTVITVLNLSMKDCIHFIGVLTASKSQLPIGDWICSMLFLIEPDSRDKRSKALSRAVVLVP